MFGGVQARELVVLEELSSALDGMQPTLTQVPPRVWSSSTQTTERPSWAARMEAT
jgi:hypothetical protein